VKQARGWQRIDPRPWLSANDCTHADRHCPAANPERLGDRVGLLWVGARFYPTPESFAAEAREMGVLRRITAVHGFELGKTWVFLAHPRIKQLTDPTTGEIGWIGRRSASLRKPRRGLAHQPGRMPPSRALRVSA
jgi:hypothetical protein